MNLVTAIVALATLRWASQPPDDQHLYGHEKAEYFSAGAEGSMILLAAITIAWLALDRLLHPAALQDVGVGLIVSAAASAINLGVGLLLLRAGRRHRSIALEADGHHLMTDVWTSTGVIAGVGLVAVTGIERLDPVVALAVAANIVVTGARLLRRSVDGLMDRALPPETQTAIRAVLDRYSSDHVAFHALRTRRSGRRSFISLHVLVPGILERARGPRPARAPGTRPAGGRAGGDRLHASRADRGRRLVRRHEARAQPVTGVGGRAEARGHRTCYLRAAGGVAERPNAPVLRSVRAASERRAVA